MTNEPVSDMSEPISYHFTPNERSEFEPFYQAIGKLARYWSGLEYAINDSIWELSNVERFAGTCMTSQPIGPGPRFRCLIALLELRDVKPDLIKAFNSFSSEVEGLGRQRNRLLHDMVVLNELDGQLYRVEATADRHLKHDFMPIDLKLINKLVQDIDDAVDRFDLLFDRVIAETPPWPRTQYAQSHGIRRERNERRGSNKPPSTPENLPQP
ncbi:hypothetical protein I6F33_33035 [Bradyrhizobium sp. BRP20]|uniref:hypothetical protein n=1 Tax=Bradyrhizobium sp. BRP20 TaxID=2793822 RepID=UPI001CD81902|nr:hypothetical protein [Bradyrhizobium sp. BRP20]MCA1437752.1 hypothetical protein [Bradyrhizobium sp. BRP20]